MKSLSPEYFLLLSVGLAAIPLMAAIGTCYLKCSIVLSLLRSGFGTQSTPSNSLVMALSLVLTLSVMEPVVNEVWQEVAGWRSEDVGRSSLRSLAERGGKALRPWRDFLLRHSGAREIAVFAELQSATAHKQGVKVAAEPVTTQQMSTISILGSFVLSEIRRGFVTAFALLVPFFVIDLVVSNILVGLGLTMMSPVVIGLPLKLLLFISCDGWLALARGLIESYQI
jgi:type III secretory pathway component EscR